MVMSHDARRDVDKVLLTKQLVYHVYSETPTDLFNGSVNRRTTVKHTIPVQATVQNITSDFVVDGRLMTGDLVGLFRFEYTHDINGSAITPKLIPKQGDAIEFLNQKYIIDSCTPATSEDAEIIAWDFTAKLADR